MSINGISSSTLNIPQLNPANGTSQTGGVGADRDGDSDGGRVSGSSGASAGGGFASAINQALSQIGVSGSTASATSSTTQDPLQALSAFIHNLFAALQSQGASQPAAAQGGDSDGGASRVSGAAGGGHHHGGANIASKLQSLIQQLSASSSSTSGSPTAGATTSGAGTSNSALSALQQSFQSLLSSQGVSGSQATLGSFLQTLAQDLPGASPAGNIVHTQA